MTRRLRAALLAALPLLAAPLAGCLQDISVEPERAVVDGQIFVRGDAGGRANIRVDISGSAPSRENGSRDLILTDAGFTDETGAFVVPTQNEGDEFFVVARHPDYHGAIGTLGPLSIGETTTLGVFLPLKDRLTGDAPDPPDEDARMIPKVPGRAVFQFIDLEQPFARPLINVEVIGDFNGFSTDEGKITLLDDGSMFPVPGDFEEDQFSGDATINDGVFTRVIDGLPPGRLRYNILLNANVLVRDPFEEAHEDMVDGENLRVIRSVMIIK